MKYVTSLVFIFFLFNSIFAQEDWSLQKDKNGIKVYTKKEGDSSLKSSKATMVADVTIARILEVLEDIPNYPEWTPSTQSAKMLKKVSSSDYYYYSVIKAPMVSNRDLVVHVLVTTNSKGETIVDMTGVPTYIDEVDGLVRMPKYKGKYTLKDMGNGQTSITLEYSTDPGGKLPDWLVNTAAVDVPYEIFTNLKELF